MTIPDFVVCLLVGAATGWLAGRIVKDNGFGLVGNIIIGIAGAILAGWLLPQMGFVLFGYIVGTIINAVIGSAFIIWAVGLFKDTI